MWNRRFHTLAPLTEATSRPKSRKIIWNDALEDYCKELKHMVSYETLLSYSYGKIPFTLQTDDSDKH